MSLNLFKPTPLNATWAELASDIRENNRAVKEGDADASYLRTQSMNADSSAVVNTTTETLLEAAGYTPLVIPARASRTRSGYLDGSIVPRGESVIARLHYAGIYSATGSPLLTLRIRIYSVTLGSFVPLMAFVFPSCTSVTDFPWSLMADVTIPTHSAGAEYIGSTMGILGLVGTGLVMSDRSSVLSYLDTENMDIGLYAQWGTANAGNSITMTSAVGQLIHVT